MSEDNNIRKKVCPGCQTQFSCCINQCWCSELPKIIPLTDNAECYCPDCLKTIIEDKIGIGAEEKQNKGALSREEMIEGIHYYYNENGNWVFTSEYHLRRGYCCENGCKHCPYGFRKK
jgi:hypothetical protein